MIDGAAAICVEGLTKVYRTAGREIRAVEDVSFEVRPNEVIGLLGPNGAGKTTTIKCICTLVLPEAGRITVNGFDTRRRPDGVVSQVAAVLEGNRNLRWDLTAKQNLEFYAAVQGHSRRSVQGLIDELLERFGLAAKRDTETGKLSRGMQQSLALAAALIRQTPILVLDEPTLGLDVDTSHRIRQYLRELAAEGRTILLSSHDMDVVQDLCDRVVVIAHGHVVTQDRVANLLRLFRSRAYRLAVTGAGADRLRADLAGRFPGLDVAEDGAEAWLQVQVEDPGDLYALMDRLRAMGAAVQRIESLDPDLEEVYVRLIKGGVGDAESLAARAGTGAD